MVLVPGEVAPTTPPAYTALVGLALAAPPYLLLVLSPNSVQVPVVAIVTKSVVA